MAAKKKPGLSASAESKGAEEIVSIKRLDDLICEVHIIGLTPVIPHKWSEKAKAMMPGAR